METKKVGIITHYYNTQNYGGALQAYALCKALNEKGACAEQICYVMSAPTTSTVAKRPGKIARILSYIKGGTFIRNLKNKCIQKKIRERAEKFNAFLQEIPHSKDVYTQSTIESCNNYDVYVTGSDQVWNFNWFFEAMFLTFVKEGKKKFAYAASFGDADLSEEQKTFLKRALKDYSAISLRENKNVEVVKQVTDTSVITAVDPTLLLSKDEWLRVCSPIEIKEKYVFCYFLGNNAELRSVAKEFARKKQLKIVTLPNMGGAYSEEDSKFGDYRLYNVGPKEFLYLINNAQYVLTDSFHASLFSCVFEKQFFAFNRKGEEKMLVRMDSLKERFDCSSRIINNLSEVNVEALLNMNDIKYLKTEEGYRDLISEEFLVKILQ